LQIYNTTRRTIPESLLVDTVMAVLEEEGYQEDSIGAVYCGNRMIRRINREFLGHDYATDTITFRYNEGAEIDGEFYISLDVIAENASRFGTSFESELLRVTIHSALHLIGYDDGSVEARKAMTDREDHYLQRMKDSGIS
jgi:rRNA maturation RNase YbeY